jgi:P-type Cu+ transporter
MNHTQILEVPIQGMDCAECTQHVQHAIATLPGVKSVDVFLASEKAVVQLDPELVDLPDIRKAVQGAGYSVPDASDMAATTRSSLLQDFTRPVLTLLGILFGVILFVVVVGEWLGLFEAITARIPWPFGVAIVLVAGYPVFRNVIRAAFKGQVLAHTLMSVGVLAALAVGQWATAAVVVFFMRVGDYVEHFTTERARRAVKDLTALAPQTARVERDGQEVEIPIAGVHPGEVVIVRPGEKIPVDGVVLSGHATLDQSTITGESMPVEAGPGTEVYAASFASLGSLKLRTVHVGEDTTFGRVIRLVEEAEAHRADVQRVADKFSAYYLPVVAGIAALTYLISRNPLSTAAVLVVACSCSFALATPIAMLASIGAAARRGLLIKGGKYLELLAKADVLLIDKTGTLTLGKPQITNILTLTSQSLIPSSQLAILNPSVIPHSQPFTPRRFSRDAILQLAASVERYSEHPLAEAMRQAARQRNLSLSEPVRFETIPGVGVQAQIDGRLVVVGSRRVAGDLSADLQDSLENTTLPEAEALEAAGKTLMYVTLDGMLAGVLAAQDTLRPEVPQSIQALRELGIRQVELLTGDNPRAAAALAAEIGAPYRAELLPEEKIAIVRQYQAQGHTVIMVGDGVNDAPSLAQADVGIAMGAAGSDIAIEAAGVALLRDDWRLVPDTLRIARRTLHVVKMNLAFTVVYNALGLTLAALGFLPPIFAAAAQSIPDLLILGNSSRLLRQK